VTVDGHVKVLDFGLARLIPPPGEMAATTTHARTADGLVLGSLGYMSPEQVRGIPADHRSDIFSFGAVLYEMLTGSHAFRRDSAVETMNAILKEDPPDLALSDARLSPPLNRTVRHCLEKEPSERFQSARDLAFDLEALRTASDSAAAVVTRRVPRRLSIWAAAALVAASLAAGVFAGRQSACDVEGASPVTDRGHPPVADLGDARRALVPAHVLAAAVESVRGGRNTVARRRSRDVPRLRRYL
jgi:hypothetical protein